MYFIVLIFTACKKNQNQEAPSMVADAEGNQYKTVQIGNQLWMAENLRTERYCNGDIIANVQDSVQWGNLTSGAWVYMNNNPSNQIPYGKLYNSYAVFDGRNICPCGWHVPTDAEWNTMIRFLDVNYNPTILGEQSSVAGGKIKTTGTQYWQAPNEGATNESGFSGLPGGSRGDLITFYGLNQTAYWWTSSYDVSLNLPLYRYVVHNSPAFNRYFGLKPFGMSVRCIKN